MNLVEFTLLALSSLFVIVDPIATAPAFLAERFDAAMPATRKARTATMAATIAAPRPCRVVRA